MKRTLLVFLLVNLMLSACALVSAPTLAPTPVTSVTPMMRRLGAEHTARNALQHGVSRDGQQNKEEQGQ